MEERQQYLKKQAQGFKLWLQEYGFTGLVSENYYMNFRNGFVGEPSEEITTELLDMHPDGYIDCGNKINIVRNFRRDDHKYLYVRDKIYGPFGFFVEVNYSRSDSPRLSFKHNNSKFSSINLSQLMRLFNIKASRIHEDSLLNHELSLCKSDVSSDKNMEVVRELRANDIDPRIFGQGEAELIRQEMERFVNFCLDRLYTEPDDRDDLSNRLVYQRLFYLKPEMSQEKKLNIIRKFNADVKSMNHEDYHIVSERNQIDVWSSSRKIVVSSQKHVDFKVRTLHPSYQKFLCPIETPHDIHAGLHVYLACLCVVAPPPSHNQRSKIQSELKSMVQGKDRSLFYNGYYIGKTNKSLNQVLNSLRKINKYCSVYEDEGIHVRDYGGRLLRFVVTSEDFDGFFVCPNMSEVAEEITHPSFYLGFPASLVPLLHHDAGPRAVFMSGMMKQVLPQHGFDKTLPNQDKVLLATLTTEALGMDVCGLNTLVRWGSYDGYNIEDGIVITKTLAQKTLIIKKSFSLKLEKEELLVPLISGDKYDKRGIVRLGTLVKNGDTLATKIKISKDGLITKSYLTALVDKESKVVEVVVRDDIVIVVAEYESNLRLGDKMVSSHSQKGVVAHVADIPSVDLVINPCSVPSRMTLGQIWEGIISNKIVEENLTTPVYFPAFTNERSLFLKYDTIDENISKDFGYWQCYNRYFVLGQRVEEKFRVRGDSTKTNINNFTNQPQKGRKRGGGLRFGVMERDVMLAHGATKTLETLTSDQSDLRECYYCNQCSSYSGDPTCSTCSSTLTKISVSQSKINKDNIMKFIY